MTERRRSSRLPAAIEALSLSLPGSRLSPETFRLAKFDRPEVSVTFWKLLYFLLKQIQDKETIEPADTEAQVRFVKRVVLSHGYRRREFYQLPSDGSEGSRELLLVFSWLMCRIGLVEQLLTLSRVKPWDETVICMCDAPLKSLKDGKNPVATTQWKDQKDVRYLQWLNGRLQFRWRNCHTEQQEHCKLLHKVHACTVGSQTNPTIGHFSVLEADVMRQPDNYKEPPEDSEFYLAGVRQEQERHAIVNQCEQPVEWSLNTRVYQQAQLLGSSDRRSKIPSLASSGSSEEKFLFENGRAVASVRVDNTLHAATSYVPLLELMESENSQLKAFLRWKPLESVYWSWMETVLDPKMESVKPHTVCKKESILASADLGCYGFGKMVEEIDRCRKDLVTLRSGLRELAKCRKLGCCEKVRARKQEQLEERELSRTIRKIQEVVELKLSDLKYHSSAMRINQMHGPHRLVFKAKCLKGSNMDHGRSAPNQNIPEGISAADVICDLKKKEARLKVELKQRQDVSRRKVQEAAEGLGQVLFIPPTKRPIIEFGKVQSL